MEFQVIDYAEEKLPLFLFLYQFDSTDLHSQRAWISEAPALHQTGFSIRGGQTQPDSDSGEAWVEERLHGKNFLILIVILCLLFFLLFLFLLCLAHTKVSI